MNPHQEQLQSEPHMFPSRHRFKYSRKQYHVVLSISQSYVIGIVMLTCAEMNLGTFCFCSIFSSPHYLMKLEYLDAAPGIRLAKFKSRKIAGLPRCYRNASLFFFTKYQPRVLHPRSVRPTCSNKSPYVSSGFSISTLYWRFLRAVLLAPGG